MSTDIGLQIEHVTKDLGGRTIVDDMQLEVRAGELTCLLGPSGCGKTTTLRMIGGFLIPDRGRILISGNDVTTLSPDKRPTAMVFQSKVHWLDRSTCLTQAFTASGVGGLGGSWARDAAGMARAPRAISEALRVFMAPLTGSSSG